MAGSTQLIEATPLAPSWSVSPWSLLLEVANVTEPNSWVLVGGLMVHVHAIRAGVVASRPTRDVDLLLDIISPTISGVAGPLQQVGFRPLVPQGTGPMHRFTRDNASAGASGTDIVDVMVGRDRTARWAQRQVLQAPAARQAIERRDWYVFSTHAGEIRISVPDPLGAIVAKAAAYTVDSRDTGRHLEDLAVLFASAGSRRALQLDRLTANDRRHLRPAMALLADTGHVAWLVLEQNDRALGQWVQRAVSEDLG